MKHAAICMLLLATGSLAFAATDSDKLLAKLQPRGYVSDYAGVFSRQERDRLEAVLAELETRTGAQTAVVVLPSIEGGEINDFANRLYEQWGIGKKGKDNGALLLAAVKERKTRIEVGYGLEGVIPDARAGRIIDQHVLPAFKRGRYADGLTAGAFTLAQLIAADANVTFSGRYAPSPGRPAQARRGVSWLHILFFIIMIPVIIRHPWLLFFMLNSGGRGGYSGGGFGRGGFGGFGGGLSGGGGASRGW